VKAKRTGGVGRKKAWVGLALGAIFFLMNMNYWGHLGKPLVPGGQRAVRERPPAGSRSYERPDGAVPPTTTPRLSSGASERIRGQEDGLTSSATTTEFSPRLATTTAPSLDEENTMRYRPSLEERRANTLRRTMPRTAPTRHRVYLAEGTGRYHFEDWCPELREHRAGGGKIHVTDEITAVKNGWKWCPKCVPAGDW
jgi:hypothetical protein